MSKNPEPDDQGGVPVRVGDPLHEYPEGIPVALPAGPEDVPEPSGAGSKSGQKATSQKKEN